MTSPIIRGNSPAYSTLPETKTLAQVSSTSFSCTRKSNVSIVALIRPLTSLPMNKEMMKASEIVANNTASVPSSNPFINSVSENNGEVLKEDFPAPVAPIIFGNTVIFDNSAPSNAPSKPSAVSKATVASFKEVMRASSTSLAFSRYF